MTVFERILLEFLTTYVVLGGLALLVNRLGVWPVGHFGIFFAGQAGVGFFMVKLGWNPFWSLGIMICVAGLVSLILAQLAGKLKGDYFIVASICLAQIIESAALALNGPSGVSGVAKFSLAPLALIILMLGPACLLIALVLQKTSRGSIAESFSAIQVDEKFAASLGINTLRLRLDIFLLAGICAAFAGGCDSIINGFTEHYSNSIARCILLFSILLLAKSQSAVDVAMGALLIVVLARLPEKVAVMMGWSYHARGLSDLMVGIAILAVSRFKPSRLVFQV